MLEARPILRKIAAALPSASAILFVFTAYAFFASTGTFEFRRVKWYASRWGEWDAIDDNKFASLAEGFLRGQLSMATQPDPRLATLNDPFNPDERSGAGVFALWDASYFDGKYYLYFSPLPVLLFYIPFRLVGGGYPSDALAGFFFAGWAFVVSLLFVREALRDRRMRVPFAMWALFIGLGNVVTFNMPHVRTYEVAGLAGMAMSASWALALARFARRETPRRAFWVGFWLALSIAARPNVGLLLVPTAVALWKPVRRAGMRLAVAALIPLSVVATSMLAYNYVRYEKLFEFGESYQITALNMAGRRVCSVCSPAEVLRMVNETIHYVFWPVTVGSEFPYVDSLGSRLDPAVSWTPGSEQVAGVAPLVPLAILGSLLSIFLWLVREPPDVGLGTASSVLTGSWLVLLGLTTCWWVVARYSLDFIMLMTSASAVTIEYAIVYCERMNFRPLFVRMTAVVLIVYSAVLAIFLGFNGADQMFRHRNPEMFQMLFVPKRR